MKTTLKDNMEVLSLDHFKENISQIVAEAHKENKRFKVESEEGTVIVLSEETFHHILVTLELLSTPGLMEELRGENEQELIDFSNSLQASETNFKE